MKDINRTMGKKSIVKAVALLTAVALSALTFSGCGKKVSDKDEQGRTVIKVGEYPVKEGKDKEKFDTKIAEFEEANPDVKIVPDTWTFDLQSFYAKAAGGQLPTVYKTNFTEVEQCINAGYCADISAALKKRGYDGMLNEKILQVVSKNNKVYALPTDAYLLGLACNINLFEQAGLLEADGTPKQPKDWDEVVEFALKIKETTGQPGFVVPSMSNVGGWLTTPIMWSYGVEFMKQDKDGKWVAGFDSDEAVAALQFIKDLKWKYDVLPANTLIDDAEQTKLFCGDKVGMMMSLGGNVGNFANYEMNPENIGFVAFPAGPKRHVTLLGGHVAMIDKNATEDQKDAVLRWLERGNTFKLTEQFKADTEKSIASALEKGVLVGIKNFSVWSTNAEAIQFRDKYIEEHANCNINHVRLYNEFLANCPADIQAEEPRCAQELYATMDSCIQEVLTNKDADCKAVLEKACKDFQSNYLDNIIE